jgi:thiamine biosynthesis lipoprotein
MGMPVTVELVDTATQEVIDAVFDFFQSVDDRFSTYKAASEISRINSHQIPVEKASQEMQLIFSLAEQTKQATYGYFDIEHEGLLDPSGIVKGWAIQQAADMLRRQGFENFYVDAGGDIQACGHNREGQPWRAAIRNPFNFHEIVKVVSVSDAGIATSGTSIRGQHIYNPKQVIDRRSGMEDIVSLTVIGPNVYEADRFATAAFAMGRAGIYFIEGLEGFEGYLIDVKGQATFTTGFDKYALATSPALPG